MESCRSTGEQDEVREDADVQIICGTKRKRRISETPTSDSPPPQKKATPYDEQQKEVRSATKQLTNGDNDVSLEDNSHYDEDKFSLEHFCDELLYDIFKFLDTWSLMTLMNVSKRFQKFVLDKRLWEDIDLSQEPLPIGILEDMLERSHDKTRSIKLRGPSPSQQIEGEIQHFNKTLRKSLTTRCTKLVTMELYGVTLDFNQITFNDFPKSLKRLVLSNCHVRVDANKSIFTGIDTILINLDELAIEKNGWFDPYYVMPISKLPKLKYLSLKGCTQMQEFIPYGSIAGRHGFKQLEVLDLRDTPLNDSDLQCFNAVETLKEIYLECPAAVKEETKIKEKPSEEMTSTNDTRNGSVSSESGLPSTSCSSKVVISSPFKSTQSNGDLEIPSTSSAQKLREQALGSASPTLGKDDLKSTEESPSTSSRSSVASDAETSSSSSSSLDVNASTSSPPPSGSESRFSLNVLPMVGSPSPARSRFLPRPDHIIYLDVRNRTSPNAVHISLRDRDRSNFRHLLMPVQGAQQQQQQQQSPPPAFEEMIRHNLFWDIINPLGRAAGGGGPDRLFGEDNDMEYGGGNIYQSCTLFSSRRHLQRGSITDRGVCCFGRTRQPVQHGVIWIRFNNRPSENRFERFSVRDYKCVTDVSLQHLVQCSPNLVFLDVSGTSVTLDGIRRFKELKPECKLIAEHLLETATTVQ
ncbi:uncharacterized protein LOC142221944 [Haematobia irritans]|uniref:uncharacterized protein LOC142221944 n=1 Tax=Haematobia irritans TaxID=7368 RepID=UPI003F4FFD93